MQHEQCRVRGVRLRGFMDGVCLSELHVDKGCLVNTGCLIYTVVDAGHVVAPMHPALIYFGKCKSVSHSRHMTLDGLTTFRLSQRCCVLMAE